MKPAKFIGRETELERLKELLSSRCASLIVVRGRRRIGKSRLLEEFGKGMKSLFFSGQAPTKETTEQSQRDEFSRQLERAGLPGIKPDDWGNMFWHLAKFTAEGRVLIVLDEISWMGDKDPDFLGKLRTIWEQHFKQNAELIMVLCGSVSSWIEENILSSTGFVGRIAIDLVLKELPLNICAQFWHLKEKRITSYEKFKLLSVTGGVPLYLEMIKPELSAEQNIRNLCFRDGGLLVREFDEIFSDLFSRKNSIYKEIISSLANGPKDLGEICKELKKTRAGLYSGHLDDLVKAGFVQRDFTWSLKDGKESKLSRYRLSDNYLRFYLKYIEPNLAKIKKGTFANGLNNLARWESVMGLQFENLVIHNWRTVWELLDLSAEDIVMDGPFFQKPTTRQPGCQIDYMIQTRFHNLYVCEVKFSKDPIGEKIINEMEQKRKRLKVPKNCSVRPVLIHVNGVKSDVEDSGYFDKIIDFGQLLQ